jgi:hypothetical protein
LGDAVHLSAVVTSPLIVELDDGEFVRSAGHEAMERLMLPVRPDPKGLPRLDRRQTLQAIIRLRHGLRVSLLVRFSNQKIWSAPDAEND